MPATDGCCESKGGVRRRPGGKSTTDADPHRRDDPVLSGQLADTLSRAGEEGHFLGDTEPYNAVVLDLRRWRAAGRTMPVLIHARLDPHGPRQLRPRRFRVSRHALGYGDGEWIPRRTSTATPTPSKCSSQARRQCHQDGPRPSIPFASGCSSPRFSARWPVSLSVGEQQDLEGMLGNLMDNACKWARDGSR